MRVNGLPLCVQAHAGGASASVGQKYPAGGHFPPPLQRVARGHGHCNLYKLKSKLFMLKFPHIEFREIPAKEVA